MARKRRARKHKSKRHKSKGIGRRLAIGLGLTLPLLYFAFTRLFFDPFEAPQASFERLVPQDVDLFLHRKALASDFDEFPEPSVPARWMRTRQWLNLTQTDWYRNSGWPADMDTLLQTVLGDSAELLAQDSPLSLLDDVLGQELALVARDPAGAGKLALLARLTPTAKLAVEALDFDGLLGQALAGASRVEVRDPDVPAIAWERLEIPDADPIFYARRTDLLVAGNDEELLRDILRTVEEGGSELSLGLSRLYHDNLRPPSEPPERRFTMEWFGNLRQLVDSYDLAPDTADRHRDALLNVLPRLIDWELLQDGIGRLEFDARRIDFEAHAELDVAAASDDKGGLLGAPSFLVEERLTELLSILPSSTGAVITANIDLKRFLNTVVNGLDSELINLINGLIRDVARYNPNWRVQSLAQLINELARVLQGELTVVIAPLDHELAVGAQPLPSLAFIAPVKDAAACEALFQTFINANQVLGVNADDMFEYNHHGIGKRKVMGLVGMPAEQISFMVYEGETMVLATDDDFAQEIVRAYTSVDTPLAKEPGVAQLISAFARPGQQRARANVALWGDVGTILEMLEPYADWTADLETQLDFGVIRPVQRRQLIAREYPEFQGQDELPAAVESEIEQKLDTILGDMERQRREVDLPARAQELRESRQWLELLGQGAVSLLLQERATELAVHLRTAVE